MKQITKSYLEYLGVIDVSTDGTVYTKNGELKPFKWGDSNYLLVNLYDPEKYKNTPKEKRNHSSGIVGIQISHLVYAWFNNEVPYGKEIHHIDLNCLNNSKANLEALSHEEHLAKHNKGTKELKCRLDRPREYYEKKIAEYTAIENKTSTEHNNLSNYRAKLRYYDSHVNEAIQAQKDKRDLAMIKELAKQAKDDSDPYRWHQLNQIIRNWKSYDSDLKEQLIQVILKGHTFKN